MMKRIALATFTFLTTLTASSSAHAYMEMECRCINGAWLARSAQINCLAVRPANTVLVGPWSWTVAGCYNNRDHCEYEGLNGGLGRVWGCPGESAEPPVK